MSNLAQIRDRVEQVLLDVSNAIFSPNLIDEGIRQALDEYSRALPLEKESMITLESDGRLVSLGNLSGLMFVTSVWWPYDEANATWPPNRPRGWQLYWNGTTPYLFFSDERGAQPQAGQKVRLWYATPHSLEGLDGAALTTLPSEHESLLVSGAAGYAAMSRAVDLIETSGADLYGVGLLGVWAQRQLREFRRALQELQRGQARRGQAWGEGWPLDRWDNG